MTIDFAGVAESTQGLLQDALDELNRKSEYCASDYYALEGRTTEAGLREMTLDLCFNTVNDCRVYCALSKEERVLVDQQFTVKKGRPFKR